MRGPAPTESSTSRVRWQDTQQSVAASMTCRVGSPASDPAGASADPHSRQREHDNGAVSLIARARRGAALREQRRLDLERRRAERAR